MNRIELLYPPYLIEERILEELWTIDDCSNGFYIGNKNNRRYSDTNPNLYYYYHHVNYEIINNPIKVVYNRNNGNVYETIIDKNDPQYYFIGAYSKYGPVRDDKPVSFQMLINGLTFEYNDGDSIEANFTYEYKDVTVSANLSFNLITFDYITNKISKEMILFNEKIKKTYEEQIRIRKQILNERNSDC